MRAFSATGQVRRLRLRAVFCTSLLIASTAFAQQIQFGFEPPAQAELTPPRVEVVSGPTAARLEQARALAANESWDEAVDIYRKLIAEDTNRVVALNDGRYVSLRTYCHLQLAGLPAEALSAYRRHVDPLAVQWYRDGISRRDEQLLRRIVDELFCSTWGDDALLALGEMALERADYASARRHWQQISPLLRSPNGLSLWLALRNVELNLHWPQVERRWLQRPQPADWLAYPDTQLDLADVRARLVLVSIRAGQPDRALLELDVFRRLHPQAVGRIGGQEGPYRAALERLVTSAEDSHGESRLHDWRTFAGLPSRSGTAAPLGPILGPAWPQPVVLTNDSRIAKVASARGLFAGGGAVVEDGPQVSVRESQCPLSCFPIVVDRTVLFADGKGIHAVDLATGEAAITADGLLYRNEPLGAPTMGIPVGTGVAVAHGVPRYSLTAAGGIVYARIGQHATTRLEGRDSSTGDRLVGLDLARDGLLTFSEPPKGAAWSFDGVPVIEGGRLFVAMRHSDVTPHADVACFDASSGTQLWRTPIGAADTPASGRGNEITHNLLTLVGNRLFFNTNLGLVAALDTDDGQICWLRRYDRFKGQPSLPLHFDRDPSPCMYHDGLLIVAPSDTPAIFALDADSGQMVWTTDKLPDALHLLGVAQQNLVVSGNRLSVLDVRSGEIRFVWPESEHAGIRGKGRGAVAGEETFWPTRTEIYVLHVATGAQTRTPISLRAISENGANLAAANGRLIVAGRENLMAFGP
jgi:outer membrane protein assembly factor BamB/tetratricopeptide (TPR) repeat protein